MKEVAVISRDEAARLIRGARGRFLTVSFVKRSNGQLRIMNCRTGVKRHLQGGEPSYNFEQSGLISVYDVKVAGYRCIPVEGLRALRIGGKKYVVEQS